MEGIQNSDVATLSLLNGGYGGGGIGGNYGNYGGFSYDGSVINSKLDRNAAASHAETDRIVDNQRAGFDASAAIQGAINDATAEARLNDKFAGLNLALSANFNQIDRRFSDLALSNQECCCDLKAGQATIVANQEAAREVAHAVATAMQNSKLDAIIAGQGHGRG